MAIKFGRPLERTRPRPADSVGIASISRSARAATAAPNGFGAWCASTC